MIQAVLVEDEPSQAAPTIAELNAAGFSVRWVQTLADFRAAVDVGEITSETELFVLDRKIPRSPGLEEATDAGDELFDDVVETFPSAAIVVLSAFTDEDHVLASMRGRGQLQVTRTLLIDRVTIFRKRELPEALQYIASIAAGLRQLDDLALDFIGDAPPNRSQSRALRRLVDEMTGVTAVMEFLGDGLTDDLVYRATIKNANGVQVGRVIAKVTLRDRVSVPVGLMADLPLEMVAIRATMVRGVCGGNTVGISQNVSADDLHSLMDKITTDPFEDQVALERLVAGMEEAVRSSPAATQLEALVLPLVRATEAVEAAAILQIDLPSFTSWVEVNRAFQHGDLHPGNVLVTEERPIVIDFDRAVESSRLLDPLMLTLGGVFHQGSPLRDAGITGAQLESGLRGVEAVGVSFVDISLAWLRRAVDSERELWSLVLGVCLRYARFPEVQAHPASMDRLRHLASVAVRELHP